MESSLTFDQLPYAVSLLTQKLNDIERLLLQRESREQTDQREQLLTVEQAAEFLSLAKPTVYGMVSRNELPYMKRSKRLYFSRAELTAYLKEGRKKTQSELTKDAKAFIDARKQPRHGGE